ncbi:MAG: transposase [Elusimicrobiota bacterium]
MRKTKFQTGNYYHIYNRGVDKRRIFLTDADYLRFIDDLARFNKYPPSAKIGGSASDKQYKNLIEIVCFCLMPNHYHLLIRQSLNGGIIKFMQKLGTGYTMYFNKKINRKGILFESKYKVVEVNNDEQLVHLSRYIHQNPQKLLEKDEYTQQEIDVFLENYRWSSNPFYLGNNEFDFLLSKEYLMHYFDNDIEKYKSFMSEAEPPTRENENH